MGSNPAVGRLVTEAKSGFSLTERAILLAIVLCIFAQAALALRQEINWDEYFFLSFIYDYQRGEMTSALQTFHVHFFSWLTIIDGDEVDQIEVARLIMLILQCGTMASIYLLAHVFLTRKAALFSTLAYASAGFVLLHGSSFRTDPIAAFLLMVSLAVLARSKWRIGELFLAAVFVALAGLVTIKSVFFAPAFAGIGLWRWLESENRKSDGLKLVSIGLASLVVFGALYWWHLSNLPIATVSNSEAVMGSALRTTLLEAGLFPRWIDMVQGAIFAPAAAILLLVGSIYVVIDARRAPEDWKKAVALIGLSMPLLSFVFYRNAFPYYFPFILPTAMILVGLAFDRWKPTKLIVLALSSLMLFTAAMTLSNRWNADQAAQTEIVATVHQMFSTPIAYIDRNSMISSFSKRGTFMSTWGLEKYRNAGRPIFEEMLEKDVIPLLILNSPTIEDAVGEPLSAPLKAEFYPKDKAILLENYIPHWGKIWVAGQKVNASSIAQKIHIAIPGRYRLEADKPVILAGDMISDGDSIKLDRGVYSLSSPEPQVVILRWGKSLFKPDNEPSKQPVYVGF